MGLENKSYGQIQTEFSSEEMLSWFDMKRQKFLHCVDTLYYTVDLQNDWLYDYGVARLKAYLDKCKQRFYEENLEIVLDEIDSRYVINGSSFAKIYFYCIESKDRYSVYIAKGKPGKNVPAVLVQLRSQFLWLYGEQEAYKRSLEELQHDLFEKYGLEVKKVMENRIDYAYHTNYVQQPDKLFVTKNLNRQQVSNFTQFRMIGSLDGENDVGVDYVGYGIREGNGVFYRMYNKTNEVCKKGYKQFFFKIWLMNGLINRYDFYCLEKCFLHRDYDYMPRARLEWYREYGQDRDLKQQCGEIIKYYDRYGYDVAQALADKLVPRVTIIFNFEYQCKRDFFYTIKFKGDKAEYKKETKSLDQMLAHKDIIHKYITNHVFRMVNIKDPATRKRDKAMSPMWQRLHDLKLEVPIKPELVEMVREYQINLDKDAVKKQLVNKTITFSLYHNNVNDANFDSDLIDYLSSLNDNDLQDYREKKKKKAQIISAKLSGLSAKLKTDTSFKVQNRAVIDLETGEVHVIPREESIEPI